MNFFNHIIEYLSNIRQFLLLIFSYNPFASNLIVFFINGKDRATKKEYVNGGIISILSLAAESKRLFAKDRNSEVFVCANFNEIYIDKYRKIENNIDIFNFNVIFFYFRKAKCITIHIPEWRVVDFSQYLTSERYFGVQNKSVHLNILNQNVQLMPSNVQLSEISNRFLKTTISTAHDRYCSIQYRLYYGLPLHLMSVYVTPEDYRFTDFNNKRSLLIYSPDEHPLKDDVLRSLRNLEWLELVEIRNITFVKYKELISEAMFSLTFGEGLDGYFVEPIFSGAIGITVYNDDFFPEDFRKNFKTVYNDYHELSQKIVNDIVEIVKDEKIFKIYQQQLYSRVSRIYNRNKYLNQIEKFYKNDFTYK